MLEKSLLQLVEISATKATTHTGINVQIKLIYKIHIKFIRTFQLAYWGPRRPTRALPGLSHSCLHSRPFLENVQATALLTVSNILQTTTTILFTESETRRTVR